MKRRHRSIVALLLTVLYTAMVMTPLAPLALRSPVIAHAVTGECAGECSLCGCDPEKSASHTCCCWQKKKQQERENEEEQVPDCCKKKQCLAEPVLTCGCPCGGNKLFITTDGEQYEQLPYRFSANKPILPEDTLSISRHDRLTHRYGDPPDPPPKLPVTS